MQRYCWLVCVGLFLGSVWEHQDAEASMDLCKGLFRKQSYERAAQCFTEQSRVYKKQKTLTRQGKLYLFQSLWNASLSWRKASQKEKSPLRVAYLREKALLLVQDILKGRVFRTKSQKQMLSVLVERLESGIGYSKVQVYARQSALFQLLGGYRSAERKHKGQSWKLRLRPGNYSMVVTYKKGSPQSRSFTIRANQAPLVLKFSPPRHSSMASTLLPPKPKSRGATPWILVGVGSTVVVGGIVLVGVAHLLNNGSVSNVDNLQQSMEENESTVSSENTREALQGHSTANNLFVTGWVAAGTGVALGLTGVVLYFLRPQRRSVVPQTKPFATKSYTFLSSD